MTVLEELIQAAIAAPDDARKDAILVLQGQRRLVVEGGESPVPEPYLSLAALGRQLGVSPSTLWRWEVPSRDLGGRPRYLRSEVDAYLKSEGFARRAASLRAERRQDRGGGSISSNRQEGASMTPKPVSDKS